MGNILICYTFKGMKLSERNKFRRKLFGTIEKTHSGKYTAITKGFLSDKNYEKPVRSVVIVQKKDKTGVIKILKMYNAKIKIFNIQEIP